MLHLETLGRLRLVRAFFRGILESGLTGLDDFGKIAGVGVTSDVLGIPKCQPFAYNLEPYAPALSRYP